MRFAKFLYLLAAEPKQNKIFLAVGHTITQIRNKLCLCQETFDLILKYLVNYWRKDVFSRVAIGSLLHETSNGD